MVEYILKDQMGEYLDSRLLLSDCQSGFRCNRSTTSLLLGLTDSIRQKVGDGGCCVLLSLDLEKAFDKIDYAILVEKLYYLFGFSVTACNLISSYLFGRSQYVFSNGIQSEISAVNSGVPQGSVLGPLLFIMYVNDLFERIIFNNCIPFAFADDLQIVFKGDFVFLDVLQNTIDYTINVLTTWMSENRLLINPDKSKVMLFGCSQSECISVSVNGRPVNVVDSLDCLGVILDNKLRFELHVNSLISKVNFTLRKLYSLNIFLPRKIRLQVVHSLIMPIFLYGLEVYSGTSGFILRKLNLLFNRVIRYVFSLKKSDHVSAYVKEFLGCSFVNFVCLRSVLHFYKVKICNGPKFLMEFFSFGRSARNVNIVMPRTSSWMNQSFVARVARVFNRLPNSLKNFNFSVHTFKLRLLVFFLPSS